MANTRFSRIGIAGRATQPWPRDWYERNAAMMACVMRDREHHAMTREIGDLRFAPFAKAWREVLGTGLSGKQRALLHLALSFYTWRALVRESGLTQDAAVRTMVQAINGAK